jgi:hypothetical protein
MRRWRRGFGFFHPAVWRKTNPVPTLFCICLWDGCEFKAQSLKFKRSSKFQGSTTDGLGRRPDKTDFEIWCLELF